MKTLNPKPILHLVFTKIGMHLLKTSWIKCYTSSGAWFLSSFFCFLVKFGSFWIHEKFFAFHYIQKNLGSETFIVAGSAGSSQH
jgi:hypothetical protein